MSNTNEMKGVNPKWLNSNEINSNMVNLNGVNPGGINSDAEGYAGSSAEGFVGKSIGDFAGSPMEGFADSSVEGIILAAGFSRRMGTLKMLLEIGGMTLIERSIKAMEPTCSKIIVVGGYGFEAVSRPIQKYKKVQMVYNADYHKGMFSSVKEGVRHLSGERFFFTPGDYPFVRDKTYREMLGIVGDIIIPFFCGKSGHPILVKTSLAGEILKENRYKTLREFIKDKGFTPIEVEDEGILMDMDTPDDYERLLKYEKEYTGGVWKYH